MPPTPQDPMEIYVDDSKLTLHGLQQHYVKLAENEKNRKLNELLDALEFNQVVIFVKSVQRAIQLDKLLQECNFPSVAIHASMKQEDRIKLYQSFKDVRRLADRAARAARAAAARLRRRPLSFAHSSSIAFSSPRTSGGAASTSSASISSSTTICPTREAGLEAAPAPAPKPTIWRRSRAQASDTYLHRVGRAGRFGTKGLAITFASTEEDAKILEDVQSRFEVSITPLPESIDVTSYMCARQPASGRRRRPCLHLPGSRCASAPLRTLGASRPTRSFTLAGRLEARLGVESSRLRPVGKGEEEGGCGGVGGRWAARTFRDVRLDQENKNDLIGKNDYSCLSSPPILALELY